MDIIVSEGKLFSTDLHRVISDTLCPFLCNEFQDN